MQLHIYDFDGTLFESPSPHKRNGHQLSGKLKSTVKQKGFGWFQNPITLDKKYTTDVGLGFRKSVARHARDSIANSDVITVMLTGRTEAYKDRIIELCDGENLEFDHYITKPLTTDFNTLNFKVDAINTLIEDNGIDSVVMWEDRIKHVERFHEHLESRDDLTSFVVNYIEKGDSFHLPQYIETELINHLIDDVAKQNKRKIEYCAVVLDQKSVKLLKSKLSKQIPDGWTEYIHHMTMIHSSSFKTDKSILEYCIRHEGREVELVSNLIGKSDEAIAIAVSSPVPCINDRPHITIATAPGEKPFKSNSIEHWDWIGEVISLTGKVKIMEYTSK